MIFTFMYLFFRSGHASTSSVFAGSTHVLFITVGTPLIWSPMGQQNLAVLTGDLFYKKCMAVLPGGKKKWPP